MARNKLLAESDPFRCTGRTTATALSALARAIATQGKTIYALDHHAPNSYSSAMHLKSVIDSCINALNLKHITVSVVISGGIYNNHVRIISNIWED